MAKLGIEKLATVNADRLAVLRFFHPVLPSWRLRSKPRRVLVAGQPLVLFRSSRGPAALLDRCAHRFSPLSAGRVRHGKLECPYHGWMYDHTGACRTPMDRDRVRCEVPTFQVVERRGALWVGDASADPSSIPHLDYDGYAFAGYFRTRFDAPLHVALDNFSENEHTPWVHSRFGWDRDHSDQIEFQCKRAGETIEVSYTAPQRDTVFLPIFGIARGDSYHNQWRTEFDPPRTLYDLYWSGPDGTRRPSSVRVMIYFVPETEVTTQFHVFTFARGDSSILRRLLPASRKLIQLLIWKEVRDDARFVRKMADAPYSLVGMQLGRFDKPLAMTRELLEKIYLSTEGPRLRVQR